MSDCAIREVLELWHNTGGFSAHDESECFEAVYTLAHAYAAEHPPDDDEPITEEWMRAAGAVEIKSVGHVALIISTQLYLHYRDGKAGIKGQFVLCHTRGDVRRLCAALGSPLREGA